MQIRNYTDQEIEKIKKSGEFLNQLIIYIADKVAPWVSLLDLEKYATDFIADLNKTNPWHDIKWAFKWFEWYPANLCLSYNDWLVHGIPSKYILKPWDLLKIDTGIKCDGYITDSAVSVVVGWIRTNPKAAWLINATKRVLDDSILLIKKDFSLFDYGRFVYNQIKNDGYQIIKWLTWHGLGKTVHEDPWISNYADHRLKSIKFRPGMVFALEPITAEYSDDFVWSKNGWDLFTIKWDLWCQREYTMVFWSNGVEIASGITDATLVQK